MDDKQYSDEKLLIEKKKLIIIPHNLEEPEDEDEKIIVNTFKQFLEKKTYIWDTTGAADYKFHLPRSEFSEEKKMNFQSFEESDITYDDSYVTDKLTKDQLIEIWEKAEFSVKSRQINAPYIWKISSWLHKGQKNIKASLYFDIKLSLEAFYLLKNRIHYCRKHQFYNLQGSFKFLIEGIKEILQLFIGIPKYTNDYIYRLRYPESYLKSDAIELYRKNLLAEHPDIITSIYFKNVQRIIKKIEFDVNKVWDKDKLFIEHELIQQNLTPKEVKHRLSDIRVERLIDAYEKTNKLNDKNKKGLINLIRSEQIYQKIVFDQNENITAAEKRINEQIKYEYPIRCQISEWYDKEYKKRIENEKKILEEYRDRRIDDEIREFPVQRAMIKSYISFKKNLNQSYKYILENYKKDRYNKLEISINYLKPYPVETYVYKDHRGVDITEYRFKRYYTIYTNTSYPFWRIVHLFRCLFSLIVHLMNFCYNYCWNHSFGLKALCAPIIVKDYSVDKILGVVKSSHSTFSYRSSLKDLFDSITTSRASFLNAQDKGFLGSKLGNLMNWIENYFFRLIFGLIFIGIFYPVLILLFSIFMFAVTLISIAIGILFYIFLVFFINVFIYDFWETHYDKVCFPLIWVVIKRFIVQFAFNLVMTIILTILQILAGVFMIFFGIFRWLLRSLYDILTYQIIRCNAKIPKANTPFAWRIAGPGISRTLFSKLEVEDALLLVKANLEKLELKNYRDEVTKKLQEPMTSFVNINKRVFNKFNGSIETPAQIWQSINPYTSSLEVQVEERKNIYPEISQQVRFTRADLDILLEATYDILRENVKDNPKMEFIWEKFRLVPLSWRLLTEKFLIDTFRSEEILIDVDDSELKYDPKAKSVKKESEEIYEKLSIGKAKMRAHKKMKNLDLFFGGKESLLADEEEYYHGKNYIKKRFDEREYENVSGIPQFYINSLYDKDHHFHIDIYEGDFADKDRYKNELMEDQKLEEAEI